MFRRVRPGRMMIVTGGPNAGRTVRVVGRSVVDPGCWTVEVPGLIGRWREITERLAPA